MATKILDEKGDQNTPAVPPGYVKLPHVLIGVLALAGIGAFWLDGNGKPPASASTAAAPSPAPAVVAGPVGTTLDGVQAPNDEIHRQARAGSVDAESETGNPHENPHVTLHAEPDIPVQKVAKPAGALGRTIEELYQQVESLEGKPVRIAGTVVRKTGGIKGLTYLHMRDGSGSAQQGTNDVTVTTNADAELGDVVTVEAALRRDVDLGLGYHYAVLLENAKILGKTSEPASSGAAAKDGATLEAIKAIAAKAEQGRSQTTAAANAVSPGTATPTNPHGVGTPASGAAPAQGQSQP